MKNKAFKFSLLYICVIIFLSSLAVTFIYGVKIGYLRENPMFDKIYTLYSFTLDFKKNINKIFNKNKIQSVNKKKFYNNLTTTSVNGINISYTGEMPKDIIVAATTSMRIDDTLNHYLLFLHENKIIHYVLLDEIKKFEKVGNLHKWPHGLIISDDNKIYYNFDGGNSLVKKDICGDRIWDIKGKFHHLMSINDSNNYLWALKKNYFGASDYAESFVKIKSDNGEILDSFNVNDLIIANSPNDYFSIKQRDLSSVWEYEPFHFNDIDVLNKKFSIYFNEFSEGDLMISSRSLNMVFIIDPRNLKVKDLIFGKFRRQHDADWNKGYITIYDNQTEWGNDKRYADSRIVKIDYNNNKKISTIKLDDKFTSDARGNYDTFDLKDDEQLHLIVSPYEGSLFLFKNNKKIFSLVNKQKNDLLSISNGKIIFNKNLKEKLNSCKTKN
ncbi:arylsulfotransferase family protein [Candidatus Pelagibacter sp.]|nr:arylsulfotransferase family protein [Candidatus Pelagibacter sp.]